MSKRDPVPVSGPLRNAAGPLLRQLRKYDALCACLLLLPPELEGLAAPYDIHLAPREDASAKPAAYKAKAVPGSDESFDGLDNSQPLLSTLYLYCASPTVASVIMQRSALLIEGINRRLAYPMVEALRCETASAQKIERQMNILRLEPD